MSKLVILKIGEGSFAQGFPVTLQVGEENARPTTEITGTLPAEPELLGVYQQWQSTYRGLGLRSRLSAPDGQQKNVSLVQDCHQAAEQLRDRLNAWLRAEFLRPVREKWLEKLHPSDPIRVIVQTADPALQKLPWHLWDLLERYPNTELALSAPVYDRVAPIPTPAGTVSVLAILGNSKGIDTQADRALLESLPDAAVRLLVEPSRQQVSDRLWEHPWDILFFAGHSSSQENGETGRIYINQTDSLTFSQLRYALKKALERGLKLAIFNSCDGLGLARELADLHIPQVIVMREPVPDQVAQAFLKYFLQAFASGEPLYQAVRQARERLQAIEDQFPCATWLPVIYQNPAEVPPTWAELTGSREPAIGNRVSPSAPPSLPSPLSPHPSHPFRWAIATSLAITALITGVRYLGWLQPVELHAFDQLMRLRPEEGTDSRLLVVTIDDEDIQKQPQPDRGSLSDGAFSQLLKQLDRYQPRVIGLDIYRDYPVKPEHPFLAERLKQDGKLIAICKVSDPDSNVVGIAPPPEVPGDRVGFSDFLEDPDGVLRRQVLFMDVPPASLCTTPYAFNVHLAARYLAAEGIEPAFTENGNLQFGKTVFPAIHSRTGGYQGIDAWGHQILLNYRASRRPVNQVSLSQVLSGQINADAVKDRIVVIGVTARSFGDYWSTPYGTGPADKKAGVVVQAEMTSQILSAVLDQRPLLWVWPVGADIAWIGFWALTSGLLCGWVWLRSRSFNQAVSRMVVVVVVSASVLYLVCFGVLTQGGWVPLLPPILAIAATASTAGLYQMGRYPQGRPLRSPDPALHQE
ncbi:CHASE2 domain-containing protein [Leptothermofonsia sichuanensis E412]|uniref:CHASE2 domain-containing protein n=1 Tax=Leptothermofonsia sichuanensis TaxID=2917832 RepID=UPI001CA6AE88|nr:CHASE2 domain-containing protein [Leptothermofonsia sichuanensis]QZZ19957.1 CHASE2 domain-containing protein [Leptothermofonsia sichuanensis E412]